jgi:rod shape-determining protein MreC
MMSKSRVLVAAIIALVLVAVYTQEYIKGFVLDKTLAIRAFFVENSLNISKIYDKYINQAETIEILREKNRDVEALVYLNSAYKDELDRLSERCRLNPFDPKVEMVRVISYANLRDFSEVWIEFNDFNTSRIYGLIKDGYSNGIVVEKNGFPLAILQTSSSCSFAVLIGKSEIPGIAFGGEKLMSVKFIPPWRSPKEGDEVVTSGLDNVFYKGIKVGKVVGVKSEESYKIATVEPYAKEDVPLYFHIIKKVR